MRMRGKIIHLPPLCKEISWIGLVCMCGGRGGRERGKENVNTPYELDLPQGYRGGGNKGQF